MAVRLDSIVEKPVRLDNVQQSVRLDSIDNRSFRGAGATGTWELDTMPGTIPMAPGTPQTIGRPADRGIDERFVVDESKYAIGPAGKFFGLEATQFDVGWEHLDRALGRTAYLGTKLATGLALHAPELAFGPDLAERIHEAVSGFEMSPSEKNVGEMTEFVGGLYTAGRLLKPLVNLMPAREALKLTTGGGATFMLRNLSEQTVDRLRKGKKISGRELLGETIVGATIGAVRAGGRQLERYARWFKNVRSDAVGQQVPRRLWMRTDEALRAAAEGMPQATWNKIYKADVDMWAQSYADAYNSMTTWTTAGYRGAADTTGIVRGADMPRAGRRAAAPVVKQLYADRPRIRLSTPADIAEEAEVLAIIRGMPKESELISKLEGLKDVLGLRKSLLRKVQSGVLTQREADIITKHAAKVAQEPIKPEPHLFQPTQLMKRVPTPGVIPSKRRVLVPQPTALATAKKWERLKSEVGPSGEALIPQPTTIEKSAFRKWVNDYSSTRALDIGVPVVPNDPDMRASRLETLKSMAKSQEKHAAKRRDAIDKSTGKPNYLNPWVSSRFMFMDFEERTGVPVYHLVENIFSKSGKASLEGYNLISNSIRLHELAGLTPLDNEHIAKYLFSPETRTSIEKDISPEALIVASRLEDILQGEAAKDVQEMVFRLWDTTGKIPPDVKQYGDPKTILKHGREAKAEGRLKEWIAGQPRWGVRRFYYMSDPMKQDMLDNYLTIMGRAALQAPGIAGEGMPGSFAYEAHARRGKPPIKEGAVVTNILTHVQRVKIANAIADDINQLYDRLGSVELTEQDRRIVRQIMNNVMMRRQPVDPPFQLMAQFRRMYWRPTMSYLWRPHTALWRSLRNSLQNYAFGPFAINVKEAGRVIGDISAQRLKGTHLEEYDPEMMKRHEAVFHSYVSQRQAYYREFLLQDTANITRDFSRRGTARKAVAMMEKTGGLYGAVDEYVNRFPIWVTQYQITKQAANDYVSGKINKNQFFRRTNLESVQKPQQMLVQDLLSEGRVDDLAEASANWITEDVNFKYKTPERAGVEQTMAERSLMGIYTFPRGQVELIYRRGVKTMLQGVEGKNVNQSYTGAANIVKGLMSSSAASALLYGYVGRRAYETYNTLAYTMLDPGTGTVYDLLSWNWQQMMRYSNKEQSLMTTIDNIAEAWAKVGETLLVPLSVEIESWYEANNDVAGVNLYRIIRNGVASKLGIEEKAFNKVTRTQKQALLHVLLGSYEYVPKEPTIEGRGTRGTRGTRE